MSSELARKFQGETRRWIWLIAVLFAIVIMAQYVELPYGNIVSYVLPDGRTQAFLNGTSLPANLSSYHNNVDNLTVLGNLNYTSTTSDDDKTQTAKISGGQNSTQESNFTSGSNSALNNTSLTSKPEDDIVPTQENGVPVNNDTLDRLHKTDGLGTAESDNRPPVKKKPKSTQATTLSISDMKDLLNKNRASAYSMEPRWSSAVDSKILEAKLQIVNAPTIKDDPSLYTPIYRNVSTFKRSYELMEQTLKVYIYKEGKRPIFHNPQPVLTGIYASEGWFMKLLEGNKQYVTNNPNEAQLFYLPFSSRMLEETLYVRDSHSHANLIKYLENYLDLIVGKYPFWNRTGGADHFLVACHDWAPAETRARLNNCTKALCNADIKEGFRLGKDVSLPETIVRSSKNPLRDIGGKIPRQRPILAFFAGQMHGYLRPMLIQQWQDKDPDIKLFTKLPRSKNNRNYFQYMKSSKYCICPRGYEVNSPRVVEAIFFECVPVIISDNFVPPFFEILNWESFAVFVQEKDLPNLKNILLSISDRRYQVMQQRVKRVQQHFLWHTKPVKYDIFHMILHSVWYNRVFQVKSS
ncbi:Exostosin domain-containing protein [Heracleum sosnowskyi]|uniref:Exostosin domain-containing protein n=1 Tax=Heracleum sosnowskyi TaxID=360622 RepID=A0AAD8MA25_9APIA|nr:Exostosin domain-containing protein [Heracleum sosnowskyi]